LLPLQSVVVFVVSVVVLLAGGVGEAWATPDQHTSSAMSTTNIKQIPQMIYTLTTGEVITYTTQHNFAIYDGGTEVFSSGSGTFSYTVNADGSNWGFAYSVAPSAISCSPAQTTFTVTTTADDASGVAANCATGSSTACTLRDALAAAAASTATGLTVNFSPTIFLSTNTPAQNTITLTGGTLNVPSNTTIQGPTTGSGGGLTNLVTVDGNQGSSVFTITGGTAVVINNLTITNVGFLGSSYGAVYLNGGSLTINQSTLSKNSCGTFGGGGITNAAGSTLVVNQSLFYDNECSAGGILNDGTLTVSNSTFTANSGAYFAGGIANTASGTANLTNVTIAGNNSGTYAGGVYNQGTMTLTNTIVAANYSYGTYADFDGVAPTATRSIYNTSSSGTSTYTLATLGLAPLGSYGGPTQTMPVLPTSPAWCTTDASTPGTGTDQRGFAASSVYHGSRENYCTDTGATNSNFSLVWTTQPPATVTEGVKFSTTAPILSFEDNGFLLPATNTVYFGDQYHAITNSSNPSLNAGVANMSGSFMNAPETSDTVYALVELTAPVSSPLYSENSNPFNVVAGPTVTGISPSSGPSSGGTTITITGTNLSGTTVVKFGAVSATNVAVVSSTEVTATIPAGTGTVDVTVTTTSATTPTTAADQYTYQTLQPLSVTAAAITVYAGQLSTQTVAQLMASYNAPGLTGLQLEAALANAEFGFTVSVNGGSYNIPLISYGTYFGANLLATVPAGAPTGTFTMTPYLIGPGAANFSFTPTAGSLTISNLQPLSVTAANITVYVGQTPTKRVAQLMASYNAPGLTGLQLEAALANAEFGFKVSVNGGSYNIPLISYGTYYGANLLQEVPAGAPTGTFTMTPYLIGPGAAGFSFSETPGSLTIASGNVSINIPVDF
jgi:CSLREA domain-containing protein